jgi:predicted negative regulator of RcsB-dependent stress response
MMADKKVKSIWILELSCLFLMHQICAAELEVSDYAAFRKCGQSENLDERLANYKNFVKEHPTSDLSDDAFLEIMKIMLEKDNIEEAKAILAKIEKNYPQGVIRRHIYVGDAEQETVAEWKRFTQNNPINSSNWGKMLLAHHLLQKGETSEAEAITRYLLKNTRKPRIPKEVGDHRSLLTEDIRGDVLKLCAEIAKRNSDVKFLKEVQDIAQKEYGVVPSDLTASIPLLEIQYLKQGYEYTSKGKIKTVYILIIATVGMVIAGAFLLCKRIKQAA